MKRRYPKNSLFKTALIKIKTQTDKGAVIQLVWVEQWLAKIQKWEVSDEHGHFFAVEDTNILEFIL